MQTIEGGTPMTCSDCGRVIFNFATIRGKMDGKTYIVGLTCVKKLLNKTLYFDNPTMWEYENQVCAWQNAMNARKWVDRLQAKREKEGKEKYSLELVTYADNTENKTYIYINLHDLSQKFTYQGHSAYIEEKYKSVFYGLTFGNIKQV